MPRACVVVSDDEPPEEPPAHMVGWPEIRWRDDKVYHRETLAGVQDVYVYVPPGRDPNALPEHIFREIGRVSGREQ